jgi:hypothetical protein
MAMETTKRRVDLCGLTYKNRLVKERRSGQRYARCYIFVSLIWQRSIIAIRSCTPALRKIR